MYLKTVLFRVMPDSNLMMHLGTSFAFTCVILPGYLEDRNIRTDSVLDIPVLDVPVFLILGLQTWASYLVCCIAGHTLFNLLYNWIVQE